MVGASWLGHQGLGIRVWASGLGRQGWGIIDGVRGWGIRVGWWRELASEKTCLPLRTIW